LKDWKRNSKKSKSIKKERGETERLMNNKNSFMKEWWTILAGEIAVSLLTVCVYLAIGQFSYRVVTGVILGSAVIILNFLFLYLSMNRAIDNYMELRGDKEMTEEEAEKFAKENAMMIQNATKLSYIIRTFTMMGALVLALLLDWFDVIATVVPLLAFRPILIVSQLIGKKKGEG
jgi:small-conductance mechanosensitive channel